MNKTTAKKYLSLIRSVNKKCVTSETLSKHVGIYPNVINETLSYFEPMLSMDFSYNLKDLIPVIEKYIEEQDQVKIKVVHFEAKKAASKYSGVSDFVYKTMTVGGLVDKNRTLSIDELKVLRKLVNEELQEKKA